MVQGGVGVGPYHPATAPGFPHAPAGAAESLPVVVKNEQLTSAHKPDVSNVQPHPPGPQVCHLIYIYSGGQKNV